MKEPIFIQKNAPTWRKVEQLITGSIVLNPDEQAALYLQITSDLSYARTYYPNSKTVRYLNELSLKIHQAIYKNKKESKYRLVSFWTKELPFLMYEARSYLLYSFLIFSLGMLVGMLSSAFEYDFIKDMLGPYYVAVTKENIQSGDPMAIYKSANELDMFIGITVNNIRVAFLTFVYGILASFGSAYILLHNAVRIGAFHYIFYDANVLFIALTTVWIHGTLEISAILLAGAAGILMGNSILFPGTYSRLDSFMIGAKKGIKIMIGTVPLFIVAGFLEGYITRLTEMHLLLKLLIILGSAGFVLWYYVWYPMELNEEQV